nr:hypothetical protein [Tanacetum cinerariifolium]
LDFTDAAIPAAGRVSAGGADPAVVISAGVSVAVGTSVASAPSSPIRDPTKGKAIATPSSPATKILHRDAVVLFAKQIKKLESKLKTKKRKLVLSDSENEEKARQSQELDTLLHLANAALHDPSASTTPSKPDNQEQ